MERSSFLRSLLFLIPEASCDWPPGLGRVERLLRKDMNLSIEAVCEAHHLGPVFTQPSSNSKDWALTSIDIIVEHIQQPTPPKAPQLSEEPSPSLLDEVVTSRVFLRIEQFVFQLSLSQILNITLEDSNKQKPASLLLHFCGCILRIFGDQSTSTEELQGIQQAIQKLRQSPAPHLTCTSVESTVKWSSEQQYSGRTPEQSPRSRKRAAQSSVQRREKAFRSCLDKFHQLEEVSRGKCPLGLQTADDAATLLNGLAEDLAGSYPEHELPPPLHPKLEAFQEQLEKTLNAFFPDRRNKQRRNSFEPTESPEATAAAVHTILQDHQRALDENVAIMSLPNRM